MVAKFVPGFSTVAPPIAGALRMAQASFLPAAGAGAALWAGTALAAGWLLRDAVQTVVATLDRQSGRVLAVLLLAAGAWLGWKLWQKHRFSVGRKLPRITADELLAAMDAGQPLLLLDLRGATMVAETGAIAGARVAEHDRLEQAVGDWPRDRLIVTLCVCPQDAGAIQAARRLLKAGYRSVKPLEGGYDVWIAATGASGGRLSASPSPAH